MALEDGGITAASMGVEFLADYQQLEDFATTGLTGILEKARAKGGVDVPIKFDNKINITQLNKELGILKSNAEKYFLTNKIELESSLHMTDAMLQEERRRIKGLWEGQGALPLKIKVEPDPQSAVNLFKSIQNQLDKNIFTIQIQGVVRTNMTGGGFSGGGPANDPLGGLGWSTAYPPGVDMSAIGRRRSPTTGQFIPYERFPNTLIENTGYERTGLFSGVNNPSYYGGLFAGSGAQASPFGFVPQSGPSSPYDPNRNWATGYKTPRGGPIDWSTYYGGPNAYTGEATYGPKPYGLTGDSPLGSARNNSAYQEAQNFMKYGEPTGKGRWGFDFQSMPKASLNNPFPGFTGIPESSIKTESLPPYERAISGISKMFDEGILPGLRGFTSRFTDSWEKGLSKVEGEARRHMFAGLSLSMAFTFPALAAGRAGITELTGLESSMAKSSALTSIDPTQIKSIKQDIIEMSKSFPQSAKDLSDAFYFIASNNNTASDSMRILKASSEGAAGGLGQVKDVADITTSILAAYGKHSTEAAHTVDVLTEAVKVGKGEADQYAGAFGKVIPIASQAKISFEQVAASMAIMTRIGLNPDEAATAFRQIASHIVAPTPESRRTMAQLGTNPADLLNRVQTQGLAQTLIELKEAAGGDISILEKLVGNIRGLTGVLATAGSQAKSYVNAEKEMENADGSRLRSMEIMAQTLEFQWGRLLNAGKSVFLELGGRILPSLTSATENMASKIPDYLNSLVMGFEALPKPVRDATMALGAFLLLSGPMLTSVSIVKNLQAALMLMGGSMAANPVALIAGISAGVLLLGGNFDNTKGFVDGFHSSLLGAKDGIGSLITPLNTLLAILVAIQALKVGPAVADVYAGASRLVSAGLTRGGELSTLTGEAYAAGGASRLFSTAMNLGTPTGETSRPGSVFRAVGAGGVELTSAGALTGGSGISGALAGIGVGFGAATVAAAGLTAAVVLGAAAWENYQAKVIDTKNYQAELTEVMDNASRATADITKHLPYDSPAVTRTQQLFDATQRAGDDPLRLTQLLGSAEKLIHDIGISPKLDQIQKDVAIRDVTRLAETLQNKLNLLVNVKLGGDPSEPTSGFWGTLSEGLDDTHRWVLGDKLGTAYNNFISGLDMIGQSGDPRGYLSGGKVNQSSQINKNLVTPNPMAQYGPFAVDKNSALIGHLLGSSAVVGASAGDVPGIIGTMKDFGALNKALREMLKPGTEASKLPLTIRQAVHDRVDELKKSDPSLGANTDHSTDQALLDAQRKARNEELTKSMSAYKSLENVLDSTMGKIREYADKTEEARINNELLSRSMIDISDASRQQALGLAQVYDKMKSIADLKDVTQGFVGGLQSQLVNLGVTSNPLGGQISNLANYVNYPGKMSALQNRALGFYGPGVTNTETELNRLQVERDAIGADKTVVLGQVPWDKNRSANLRSKYSLPSDTPPEVGLMPGSKAPLVWQQYSQHMLSKGIDVGDVGLAPADIRANNLAISKTPGFDTAKDRLDQFRSLVGGIKPVLPMPGNEARFELQKLLQANDAFEKISKGADSAGLSVADYMAKLSKLAVATDGYLSSQRGLIQTWKDLPEIYSKIRLIGHEQDPFAQLAERLGHTPGQNFTPGQANLEMGALSRYVYESTADRIGKQNAIRGQTFAMNQTYTDMLSLDPASRQQADRYKTGRAAEIEIWHNPELLARFNNPATRHQAEQEAKDYVQQRLDDFDQNLVNSVKEAAISRKRDLGLSLSLSNFTTNFMGAGADPRSASYALSQLEYKAGQEINLDPNITDKIGATADKLQEVGAAFKADLLGKYTAEIKNLSDAMATLGDDTGLALKSLSNYNNYLDSNQALKLNLSGIDQYNAAQRFGLDKTAQDAGLMSNTQRLAAERQRSSQAFANKGLWAEQQEFDSATPGIISSSKAAELAELYQSLKLSGKDQLKNLQDQNLAMDAHTELAKAQVQWHRQDLDLLEKEGYIGQELNDQDKQALQNLRDQQAELIKLNERKAEFQSFVGSIRQDFEGAFKSGGNSIKNFFGDLLHNIAQTFRDLIIHDITDDIIGGIFGKGQKQGNVLGNIFGSKKPTVGGLGDVLNGVLGPTGASNPTGPGTKTGDGAVHAALGKLLGQSGLSSISADGIIIYSNNVTVNSTGSGNSPVSSMGNGGPSDSQLFSSIGGALLQRVN